MLTCLPSTLRTGLLRRAILCQVRLSSSAHGNSCVFLACSWALGCVRGCGCCWDGRHGFGAPGLCPCAGTWAERLLPIRREGPGELARCVLPRGRRSVPGFWVASTVGVWDRDGRVFVMYVPLCATLGCSGPRVLCLCREMEPRALEIGRRTKASTRRSNPPCAVSRQIGSSLLAYVLVCAWSRRNNVPIARRESTVVLCVTPHAV